LSTAEGLLREAQKLLGDSRKEEARRRQEAQDAVEEARKCRAEARKAKGEVGNMEDRIREMEFELKASGEERLKLMVDAKNAGEMLGESKAEVARLKSELTIVNAERDSLAKVRDADATSPSAFPGTVFDAGDKDSDESVLQEAAGEAVTAFKSMRREVISTREQLRQAMSRLESSQNMVKAAEIEAEEERKRAAAASKMVESSRALLEGEVRELRQVRSDLSLARVLKSDLSLARVLRSDLSLARVLRSDLSLARVLRSDLSLARVLRSDPSLERVSNRLRRR
jgi:chromosome segregation ATPase